MKIILAALLLVSVIHAYPRSKNVTDFFNGLSQSPYEVFSGYIPVRNDSNSSAYIFYQVNSAKGSSLNDSTKPLILWMQGGPGCSGLYGLYHEMGPFQVANKTVSINGTNTTTQFLVENPLTWSKDNHMIFVDQPIGVAYSILGNRSWPNTTYEESFDFERFLIGFFEEFPNLRANDFYIFSESYGGHYVPAFAAQIIANKDKNKINLVGIGVGDGLTDFLNQMVYSSATFTAGLVSSSRRDSYKNLENLGSAAILNGNYELSTNFTEEISGDESEGGTGPASDSIPVMTGINPLNFAQYPPSQNDGTIEPYMVFLNNNNTKENLGVPLDKQWAPCGDDIYRAMWADISYDFKGNYTIILQNARVIIYTGQNDMAVPTPGTLTWMEKIKWTGIRDFKASPKSIWKIGNNVVGSVKKSGNLTRAIVYDAGHGVPHDRPDVALNMVTRWLNRVDDWTQ
jgi:carboxypeptidase C (cathepsin A)